MATTDSQVTTQLDRGVCLERLRKLIGAKEGPPTLTDSLRTALAAVLSVLVARLFHLPESYWAAIATLIVMQSSLGAALPISVQRFVGTILRIRRDLFPGQRGGFRSGRIRDRTSLRRIESGTLSLPLCRHHSGHHHARLSD